METAARIEEIRNRVREHRDVIRTDEAVKASLVMPFLRAIGYDVFDPIEVVPAYRGINAGRADYAVYRDGHPIMLVAVGHNPADLTTEHARHLAETLPDAGSRCAILTDGISYRFHVDMDEQGKLDPAAFLVVDLASPKPTDIPHLERFSKENFEVESVFAMAREQRFPAAVLDAIVAEMTEPTDAFHDLVSTRLHALGVPIRDDSRQIVDDVAGRIARALEASASGTNRDPGGEIQTIAPGDDRVMTADELDAYHIVRALCARHIDPNRVVPRPAKSYCAILLDDNNRRPIARLHFNSQSVRYVGTFVEKDETKTQIDGVRAVYGLEDKIVEKLREMAPEAFERPVAETQHQHTED